MDYNSLTIYGGKLLSPASSQIIVTPFKKTWLSRESLALVYEATGGTGADMSVLSGKRVRLRGTVPANNEAARASMYLQLRQEQLSAVVRLPISSKTSLLSKVIQTRQNNNKVTSYLNLLNQPGLTASQRTTIESFLNTYISGASSFYPESIAGSWSSAFNLVSAKLVFYPHIDSMDASLTFLSAPL